MLIAAAIPTIAALLAMWREAAVSQRRHHETRGRLQKIETATSAGPEGSFVTRREFTLHADADSERFDSINDQLAEIRRLLKRP